MIEDKYIQPVILCGGFGTRLWPLSTPNIPKQFISLGSKGSFLEQTIERTKLLKNSLKPLLIMHEDHKTFFDEMFIDVGTVVYEKYSNDTAVAIARICYELNNKNVDGDTILLILPADHYIENETNFNNDILSGLDKINDSNIILFGIQPTEPETKYGYIVPEGEKITFKEKPDVDTANELISKNALWNSGIFVSKLKTLNNCFFEAQCDIMDWVKNPREGKYPSFDVAVLQQYKNICYQRCLDWGWSDVGTWNSFVQIPEIKNELSTTEALLCNNVHILNRSNTPVAVIGCKNLLIINTHSGILILSNEHDHSNHLKTFTNNLYN